MKFKWRYWLETKKIQSNGIGIKQQNSKTEAIAPSKVYSADDLSRDLDLGRKSDDDHSGEVDPVVRPGDLVYNLVLKKAAIVSKENASKILSQRDVKIIVDPAISGNW